MPQITGDIKIKITVDNKSPDDTIVILTSTDPLLPKENWTVVASVPGDTTEVAAVVTPGINYFSGFVKNFWGNSDFSGAVATPPIPSATGVTLSLSKS